MPMIAPRAPALGDPDTATGGLAALRAGQPDAIALCYEAHASGLLALAYRLTGSRDDAEDIVHDVFVGLPQALRNYEERGQFGAWLKRITARTALMQQRRARNRRETPTDVNLIPSVGDADDDAQRTSVRTRVADALNRLSPPLRAVFVLKMVEGRTHAEIATLLGISTGTSEVRLSRAVAQLRSLLGDRT
ncbi:RNA polymerase sigma factor [Gemmatimonas sp.]|uniref:RNA polymerase sigma factor n=2 Tax=Gemmatimonas sp. TaxID=1962908 RepID=UPI0025BFEB65|nr:sigma-70 family RNA polymerase sigma factor [Gemmatimonas sp.]MCA2985794.1 sigma-70 family RNA polymerase sigma factor [Gemmatimonas sp.]